MDNSASWFCLIIGFTGLRIDVYILDLDYNFDFDEIYSIFV